METKELNYTKVKDSADRIDPKLIALLADHKETKEKFFTKIKDVYVFNINDFKFFLDENKINNSYTQFANQIGLSDGTDFLKDRGEVVLGFPYKDCVLEGGQSTEEGMDTYFEYSEKSDKYEEKTAKRSEVFFNQVLARDEIDRLFDKKALVNWKRHTKDSGKDGEAVEGIERDENGMIKENLVIKGNNLLALHSLKSEFAGKVKLIYIDPPYNTGNDGFKYNDSFNHSTWLSFMKNRLEIAKELLKDDGLIFIQCDDNEQSYLKILMDEIFNQLHQSTMYVQVRYAEKQLATAMRFHKLIETIFVYSKTEKPLFYQDLTDYDISKYEWEISELGKPLKTLTLGNKKVDVFEKGKYTLVKKEKTSENLLKEIWASGKVLDSSSTGRFFRDFLTGRYSEDGYGVLYKVHGIGLGLGYRYITGPQKEGATKGKYYQEIPQNKTEESFVGAEKAISNFYDMASDFGNCRSEGGVELRSGKKPEVLLEQIIKVSTQPQDLVLDFHAGSGTTCAVAHKMNRQWIGIEQMDYIHDLPEARLKGVIKGEQTGISKDVNWKGGGSFIYFELAKWNEQAKEEINGVKDYNALEKMFDTLYEKYFFNYNVKIKEFKEKVLKEENFKKLTLDEQKRMFLTMLDLNQMYVQESEMDDKRFQISKDDQKLTKEFYSK